MRSVDFIANLLVFLALVPVMAGLTAIDLSQVGGLMQRCAAVVVYVPKGVAGWLLLRRMKQTAVVPAVKTA